MISIKNTAQTSDDLQANPIGLRPYFFIEITVPGNKCKSYLYYIKAYFMK
jgi:hypothetical protein